MAPPQDGSMAGTPSYSPSKSLTTVKDVQYGNNNSSPPKNAGQTGTKVMPLGVTKLETNLMKNTKFGMRRETFELVTVFIRLMLTTTAVVFAALFLVQNVVNYVQLQDVDKTFELSSISLAVVAQVGRERGLSGGYISSSGGANADKVSAQRLVVDERVKEFQAFVKANSFSSEVTKTIDAVQEMLATLGAHREKVTNLEVTGAYSLDWYSLLNFNLLSIGRKLPTVIYDTDMSNLMVAYIALGSVIEFAGIERGTFNTVLGAKSFTGNTFERVVRAMQTQQVHFETFQSYAPQDQLDKYTSTVTGSDVNQTSVFQGYALASANVADIPATYPGLTLDTWWATRSAVIDLQIQVLDYSKTQLASKADEVFATNRQSLIFSVIGTFASSVSAIYLTVGAVVGFKRIKRIEDKKRTFIRKVEEKMSQKNLLAHKPKNTVTLHESIREEDEEIDVELARPRNFQQKLETLMSMYDEDLAACDSARDLNEAAAELDELNNAEAPIWQSETTFQAKNAHE